MNMNVHFFATRVMMTLGIVTVLAGPVASAESIIFVDDDAPSGGDGTSWTTAYRFLSDALSDVSREAQEYRVAQGIYLPDRSERSPEGTGDRESTFTIPPDVTIKGGFAGIGAPDPDVRNPNVFETILSGDVLGENSYHVVTIPDTGEAITLSGIVVTDGVANGNDVHGQGGGIFVGANPSLTLMNVRVLVNRASDFGAGLFIQEGEETGTVFLHLCTFDSNTALFSGLSRGAGIASFGADLFVQSCDFTNNTGAYGGGVWIGLDASMQCASSTFDNNTGTAFGAAIYIESEGSLTVSNCEFTDGQGAAINSVYADVLVQSCEFRRNDGGAIGSFVSHVVVEDSVFVRNDALCGGAILLDGSTISGSRIERCIFHGNLATRFGGGAIDIATSNTQVINCVFAGNLSDSRGGAIYNGSLGTQIINCSIVGNEAMLPTANPGGGIFNAGGTLDVQNSVLYDNVPDSIGGFQKFEWEYSLLEDETLGPGSAKLDPLVLAIPNSGPDGQWSTDDDDYGDLRLLPGSPAIDAGQNTALPIGVTTDVLGNPRFVDDPETEDCALTDDICGDPPIVDIGAYEFQGFTLCSGDLTDDGVVGPADLAQLLGQWGGDGFADFDDDDDVGPTDLAILLGAWGPCS